MTKLSDWISDPNNSIYLMRIIEDGDPNNISDRRAYIDKSPSVFNGEKWISGPITSKSYGLHMPSQKWCDNKLKELGYILPTLTELRNKDSIRASNYQNERFIGDDLKEDELNELWDMFVNGNLDSYTASWWKDKAHQIGYRLLLRLTRAENELKKLQQAGSDLEDQLDRITKNVIPNKQA